MTGVLAKGELAGVRVLVVDDEPEIREVLQELLSICGMEVAAAASGNQAFALFRASRPDIVLSDIGMDDGTGLELIRRIRGLAAEQGGLTPAIATSAASSARECLEAGYHFFLAKPLDPLGLLDTIRNFVRAERVGHARWSVVVEGAQDLWVRFEGHVTATDMRDAVSRVAQLLSQSPEERRVVVDLSHLSGFDPSVGAVAQVEAWTARHKISRARIIGGSWLAHLVARSSCLILGCPCEVVAVA